MIHQVQVFAQTMSGFMSQGLEQVGNFAGRIETAVGRYPQLMETHSAVAAATFAIPTTLVFAFFNRISHQWERRIDDPEGQPLPLHTRVVKHLVLSAVVAIPTVMTSIAVSLISGYALPKFVYIAIAVTAIALRFCLAPNIAKEREAARTRVIHPSVQTPEQEARIKELVKTQEKERQEEQNQWGKFCQKVKKWFDTQAGQRIEAKIDIKES